MFTSAFQKAFFNHRRYTTQPPLANNAILTRTIASPQLNSPLVPVCVYLAHPLHYNLCELIVTAFADYNYSEIHLYPILIGIRAPENKV